MTNPTINLPPHAWYRATWRNLPPQPRPEPPVFDLEEKLALFRRHPKLRSSWNAKWKRRGESRWKWDYLWPNRSAVISAEEAKFWLLVFSIIDREYDITPKQAAEQVQARWGESVESLIAQFESPDFATLPLPEIIIPFYNLLSLPEMIAQLRLGRVVYRGSGVCIGRLTFDGLSRWMEGWHKYMVPQLTEAERVQIRDALTPEIAKLTPARIAFYNRQRQEEYPGDREQGLRTLAIAASVGGFSDKLAQTLADLPDGVLKTADSVYFDLAFGLDDPRTVERELRRLDGFLRTEAHLFGWLAHTEAQALDWIVQSIQRKDGKADAVMLTNLLGLVQQPTTATRMLSLRKNKRVAEVVLHWLNDHPELTIHGLHPIAAQGDKAARKQLRRLARQGHVELLQEVNGSLAEKLLAASLSDAIPVFSAETTLDWLTQTADAKLPWWLDIGDLPAVVVGSHRLNPDQRTTLLQALKSCKISKGELTKHPLVASVREHADATYLDSFAWALFEQWIEAGAPSAEKWTLLAIGLLGNDASVLKLMPLVRKWPGEGQHKRAVFAIDCLRMIGSDTALMQINSLATKNRYKGLKKQALLAINQIAEARHLSIDQLADRIIPDGGLDERGQRTFDYGTRKFTFALSDDMKPVVRDEKGKMRANLPKPGKRDEMVQATAAYEAWKLIKKQVRDVIKVQMARLEKGMISQRRWTVAEFEKLYVQHPLMTHLVQRLIWAGFDAAGTLVQTVRVTEDREYTDVEDEVLMLDEVATVGILHPLHLNSAERTAWRELLTDYEIIPPFPQLNRRINELTAAERESDTLQRLENVKIDGSTLHGILNRTGWVNDLPADGGMFYGHSRQFPFANVTAIIMYSPGIYVRHFGSGEPQMVTNCCFVPGLYEPETDPDHKTRVPLAEIDPIVVSEVLSLLHVLADKAE